MNNKIAFFIDGGFAYKQIKLFKSFDYNGENLKEYCKRHLELGDSIYRIFYYDAPPLEVIAKTPKGNIIDFSQTNTAKRTLQTLDSIRNTPFFALRLGKVSWHKEWIIKNDVFKKVIVGTKQIEELNDDDFIPIIT